MPAFLPCADLKPPYSEATAGLFKRLTFAGVNIVTLAEGDITHRHIGSRAR